MGIQSSFEKACSGSSALRRSVEELSVAVTEDCPLTSRGGQSFRLEEKVREMQAVAEQLQAQLAGAHVRVQRPLDEIMARGQLTQASHLFCDLLALFAAACMDARLLWSEHEGTGKLTPEWRLWMEVLDTDLLQCLPHLQHSALAIFDCWAELAERMSPLPSFLLTAEAAKL